MVAVSLFCLKIRTGQQFSDIIAISLKGQQLIVSHKSTFLYCSPAQNPADLPFISLCIIPFFSTHCTKDSPKISKSRRRTFNPCGG